MFARSLRAETRNRAKDELKRAINSIERVRSWEKKWIVVKDTTMKIYKWVPATGDSAAAITNRKLSKPQLKVEDEDASRTVPDVSAENSREGLGSESGAGISRLRGNFNINEDSNTGFSETGFDSDSNQAFEGRRYQTGAGESTDFSALRQAELDESTDEPPAKRLKDM